jgi:ATP-dependent Lon protease
VIGMELDALDRKAAEAFSGHLVRKDLVRRFRGQFPVPTYVVEFMLGRYCASTDPAEIAEGLELVQEQLADRTVRAGEEELFKAKAREGGSVRIIDLITARLDAKTDSYLATLPSLRLTDVRIGDRLVSDHERMLTGGFYAEIELGYDASIAQEKGGRPFEVLSLREIQLSTRGILEKIAAGRRALSTAEWKDLLLRSVGLEPETLSQRARDVTLLRMVPFVERNYNMIELGPRGTGKSHLFQQISPYAHLVSGGKATVARMFVNMASGQRGLVCQYDVVCFDEVSGVSFDQKDGVNIMKGYMESGEFSRGRESIRADGSIVLVGNFEVDVQHQQRIGHLFGPLPPEMRNDTAFMDRIHAYLPGWDIPKVSRDLFTDHFGLVSDVLAECFSRLRSQSRVNVLQGRVHFGGALSGRDQNAVNKTVSGLVKLLYPDPSEPVPDDDLEWAVRLALEVRRRVKEQQKRIGSAEFRNTQFSYVIGLDGIEKFVATPELQSEDHIGSDPLPAGQAWAISPGGQDEATGLYRIEVTEGRGSGVRILNQGPPAAFRESVRIAEQNLYARSRELVGDRNPREHEFAIQLRSFDASKSGADLGVAVLIALASALLGRPLKGGLVLVGGITLGGSIEPIHNPVDVVELALEKGAAAVLLPVSCRRALVELSDEVAARVQVLFYLDAPDALRKAIHEG